MNLTGQQVLMVQLSSSVTTRELSYSTYWEDSPHGQKGSKEGLTSGVTAKEITYAPGSTLRGVKRIYVRNIDTVSSTVTILRKDGSMNAILYSAVLAADEYLAYGAEFGWVVSSNTTSVVGGSGNNFFPSGW
jgi:hypothetical protein